MKSILIFVLVIAVVIMVIGLANLNGRADVGYVFGTWDDASLLAVSAAVAGVVLLVGIVAAFLAAVHARRDRHRLEVELQQLYVRLRAAEGALAVSTPLATQAPESAEVPETAEAPETTEGAQRPAGSAVAGTPVIEGGVEPVGEEAEAAASAGESVDEPAD